MDFTIWLLECVSLQESYEERKSMDSKVRLKRSHLSIIALSTLIVIFCCDLEIVQKIMSKWNRLIEIGRLLLIGIFLLKKFCTVYYCKEARSTKNRKKNANVFLCATLMVILIGFSTLVNKTDIGSFIFYFSKFYLICIFLEIVAVNEERLLVVLNTWKWIIALLVILDLCTIFMFPEGMYTSRVYSNNWLLGYKTERLVYSLPMLAIFAYTSIKKNNKIGISTFIVGIIACIDTILSDATAASVIIIFILVCFIFIELLNNQFFKESFLYKFLNYKVILVVYAICIIAIVFSQNIDFVEKYLVLLGKSEDLSGRFRIWSVCIDQIIQSPLIGKGYMASLKYVSLIGFSTATSAHNMVLTILIDGGILNLIIYIIMYKLALERKEHVYLKTEIVLIVCIYGTLFLGITSSTFVFSTYAILFFWLMEFEKSV